jgi:hypothetical protein
MTSSLLQELCITTTTNDTERCMRSWLQHGLGSGFMVVVCKARQ